jgi:hypothetical protein
MDALARERGFSAIAYGENADDLGTFKQIGEEAARIAARGSSFLISHKHGRNSTTVGRPSGTSG